MRQLEGVGILVVWKTEWHRSVSLLPSWRLTTNCSQSSGSLREVPANNRKVAVTGNNDGKLNLRLRRGSVRSGCTSTIESEVAVGRQESLRTDLANDNVISGVRVLRLGVVGGNDAIATASFVEESGVVRMLSRGAAEVVYLRTDTLKGQRVRRVNEGAVRLSSRGSCSNGSSNVAGESMGGGWAQGWIKVVRRISCRRRHGVMARKSTTIPESFYAIDRGAESGHVQTGRAGTGTRGRRENRRRVVLETFGAARQKWGEQDVGIDNATRRMLCRCLTVYLSP